MKRLSEPRASTTNKQADARMHDGECNASCFDAKAQRCLCGIAATKRSGRKIWGKKIGATFAESLARHKRLEFDDTKVGCQISCLPVIDDFLTIQSSYQNLSAKVIASTPSKRREQITRILGVSSAKARRVGPIPSCEESRHSHERLDERHSGFCPISDKLDPNVVSLNDNSGFSLCCPLPTLRLCVNKKRKPVVLPVPRRRNAAHNCGNPLHETRPRTTMLHSAKTNLPVA